MIALDFEALLVGVVDDVRFSETATNSTLLSSLPSPDEIAFRSAEIRGEWSLSQRSRRRVDLEKAAVTDLTEGFLWPEEQGNDMEDAESEFDD